MAQNPPAAPPRGVPLRASRDAQVHRPHRFEVQLDIFDHSRDVMLRNDVLDALQRFDAAAARSAWRRLEQAFPSDGAITPLAVLLDALERRADAPFANHEAARETVRALAERVLSTARRLFGDNPGAEWLLPLWRLAAQRAAPLPFRAAHAEEHAAALWLRAREWQAAAHAVAGIESWRRIPAPLAWMVQIRHRIDGLDVAWPLLAELAWLAPARFGAVVQALGDPVLDKLRRQFDASFEGRGDATDLAWFPAWLLTQKSGLARLLGAAQPSGSSEPEQTMRVLVEIIGLERQGRQHELVGHRRRLRGLHEALYGAYMKTR
jgi:hypothetical protein